MRVLLLSSALVLCACSSAPDAPTASEATSALSHELQLSWTATTAPDGAPVRVDASGRHIALVPAGMPSMPPRAAKPPTVSDVSVSACEPEGDAVACDTLYRLNGSAQPLLRVRYWRHGSEWRARMRPR